RSASSQLGRRVRIIDMRPDRLRFEQGQDVAQVRLDEDVREADALAAEAQDPVDFKTRNPDTEAAAGIRAHSADLFAPAGDREKPGERILHREEPEEAAICILDMNSGIRHRVIHAVYALDDFPADAPEE